MKNSSNTIRTICEVGIFAALGYVLDELQSIISKPLFPAGGSIGFAMIAVLIIAYRRGWLPAILTGLIMGTLDIATSAYILHPAQLLLDYILPYALVGLVGFLKPIFDKQTEKKNRITWLIVGTVLGGFLKLLSHYLAGVIFWADPNNFVWGLNRMNVYLYAFIYNFAFIGPSIVLTSFLLVAIYVRAPRILIASDATAIEKSVEATEVENKKDYFQWTISIIVTAIGAFAFVFFLIKYIKSFSDYQDGSAYGYDFDPDSMINFIHGFMLMVFGSISIIALIKHTHSDKLFYGIIITILSGSLTYSIARLIRMYIKEKDPTTYWIWFGIGLATLLLVIGLFVFRRYKSKKNIA